MSRLLLVRAPGLTPEQASRGDLAAHISDIIADGSFARLSGPPDLGRLPAGALKVVEIPFTDVPSFDAEVGRLRGEGLPLAIVSESVLITQRWFKDVKPGAVLAPSDAERLLSEMAR